MFTKLSVEKMIMLIWMCEKTRKDCTRNAYIGNKIVVRIKEKLGEDCLKKVWTCKTKVRRSSIKCLCY